MKQSFTKALALLLTLSMAVSMASCGSKTAQTEATENTAPVDVTGDSPVSSEAVEEEIIEDESDYEITDDIEEYYEDWIDDSNAILDSTGNYKYELTSGYDSETDEEVEKAQIIRYVGTEEKVEIPQKIDGYPVYSIEDGAFSNCESLVEVVICEGVEYIEYSAFADCKNLTTVTIPSSVYGIRSDAFGNCINLLKIIGNLDKEDLDFDSDTFFNTAWLKEQKFWIVNGELIAYGGDDEEVVIPSQVRVIGGGAFRSNTNLKRVTIPDSVTEIEYEAFEGCSSLSDVAIALTDDISISVTAFRGTPWLEKNSPLMIGDKLIAYAGKEPSYTIPDNVRVICSSAFANTSSLKEITIPDSVEIVADGAFSYCENLNIVNVGTGVKAIGVWDETGDEIIVIGRDGEEASNTIYRSFEGCNNLTQVNISENNKKYSSLDGIVLNKKGENVLFCPNGKNGICIIPEGAKAINEDAFSYDSQITAISLPSTLTEVNASTFEHCNTLREIRVSSKNPNYSTNGKSMYDENGHEIGMTGGVLFDKKGENMVVAPYYSVSTFSDLPETVTSLAYGTFAHSTKLKDVVIPNSVKSIGKWAFGESSVTSVVIPDGVKTLEYGLFMKCKELKSVTLPKSIETIKHDVFNRCDKLTDIYYEGSESDWGQIDIKDYLPDEVTIHYNS